MSAAVNLNNLREMTDGDPDIERELFQVFLNSAEECLAALRACSETGAEEEWRRQAHAWKGISLNLGAEQLGQLCKIAQENPAAPVQEKLRMIADIQDEYERVKLYLQTELNTKQP